MSEEAKFSYTCKNQAGDLCTARGDSWEEFATNAELIRQWAGGVPTTAQAENTVRNVLGGTEVNQELPSSINPACKDCGAPTRYEEWVGKNGKNAGKQFKAYKCTRDKDHRPEWVN